MKKRKICILLVAAAIFATLLFATACGTPQENELDEKAAAVTLSPAELTLKEGESCPLTALVTPVSWKGVLSYYSDDESVAVCNADGVVTAVKAGTVRIYAKADDAEGSMTLTVEPLPVAPVIDFAADEFSFDLAESDSIWDFFTVKPSDAETEITVTPDAVIEGRKIIFTAKGEYTVTVIAVNDGIEVKKSVTVTVADSNAFDGKGTATEPYIVQNEKDLRILVKRNNVLEEDFTGVFFRQTADIEISASDNWEPIGLSGIPFAGNYDGNGFEIAGLFINTSRSFQGLFGFLEGSVKNLTVRGDVASIYSAGPYSHSFAGGIAGAMNNGALIENCVNYVNITADSYAGGIVGEIAENDLMRTDAATIIRNCINYGTITAVTDNAVNESAMYFGGIAGRSNGIITDCENRGIVKTETDKDNAENIGGITGLTYYPYKTGMEIGDKEQYAVRNCRNFGEITGYRNTGGIVGNAALPVIECTNYAAVKGRICTGGVVGLAGTKGTYETDLGRIEDCVNEGNVDAGLRHGGGICGYSYVDIADCTNKASVVGANGVYNLGGIVGTIEFNGNVGGCENTAEGKITGLYGLGGIIGWYTQCAEKVSGCINRADIVSTRITESSGNHVGGIVGMLGSTNSAENCINYGAVSAGGGVSGNRSGGVGGIAGSMYSSSVISECENHGKIYGISRLGGIVGFAKCTAGSKIYKSVNRGVVESSLTGSVANLNRANMGCIAGYIISGSITDCENYGYYIIQSDKVINYGYNYGLAESSPAISGFINHYTEA